MVSHRDKSDSLGICLAREVKILFNKYSEAGEFRFSFDVSDLSSGIYLLQLQMDNHYVNQKIIPMK